MLRTVGLILEASGSVQGGGYEVGGGATPKLVCVEERGRDRQTDRWTERRGQESCHAHPGGQASGTSYVQIGGRDSGERHTVPRATPSPLARHTHVSGKHPFPARLSVAALGVGGSTWGHGRTDLRTLGHCHSIALSLVDHRVPAPLTRQRAVTSHPLRWPLPQSVTGVKGWGSGSLCATGGAPETRRGSCTNPAAAWAGDAAPCRDAGGNRRRRLSTGHRSPAEPAGGAA